MFSRIQEQLCYRYCIKPKVISHQMSGELPGSSGKLYKGPRLSSFDEAYLCRYENTMKENQQERYGTNTANGVANKLTSFLAHEEQFAKNVAEIEQLSANGALLLTRAETRDSRQKRELIERGAAIRWFSNAVADLYDLNVPKTLPQHVRRRLKIFQQNCLRWASPTSVSSGPTAEDVRWAVQEANELLKLVEQYVNVTNTRQSAKAERTQSATVHRKS